MWNANNVEAGQNRGKTLAKVSDVGKLMPSGN